MLIRRQDHVIESVPGNLADGLRLGEPTRSRRRFDETDPCSRPLQSERQGHSQKPTTDDPNLQRRQVCCYFLGAVFHYTAIGPAFAEPV
jgi:hypothetical protein